jgi:general secretion pathway protein B
MSYILDALKKSEKKRMQATVPDVLTAQEIVYHEPKARRLWPYLIVAALIINALAVVWFAPWKSKKSSAVVESGVVTKLASKEPDTTAVSAEKTTSASAAAPAQSDADAVKPPEDTKSVHGADATRPHVPTVKGEGEKKKSGIHNSETDAKATRDTKTEAPPETTATAAPAEPKHPADVTPVPNKVYSLSELPLSVQQKLPSFGISVFLYSDNPASRMVKINNKMLREGDYLSEGLKLDEIRQDSLILSYQSFRFRVGLK